MRALKQIYKYGNDSLSITDLLGKDEIVNYLEQGKKLTYPSQREKLRKELGKHGDYLEQLVKIYNLQNPPQQREIRDDLYGAQRIRANLPKKDTRGNVFFGPEKPLQPPRRKPIGVINVNGENLTARQALDRFPRLRGFLQGRKRQISEKSLRAKVRTWFKKNKITNDMLSLEP